MLSPAERRNLSRPLARKTKVRDKRIVVGPTLEDLALISGISAAALSSRRRRGMSIKEAVTAPLRDKAEAGRLGKAKQMEGRRHEQS